MTRLTFTTTTATASQSKRDPNQPRLPPHRGLATPGAWLQLLQEGSFTMSTPITEPTPTPAPPVEPQQPQDGEAKTFDADYVAKLRQEAAKYRTEAKANADAAARLAEIEEANKTEAQKLADRLAAAEAKAQEAELRALRSDVSREKGVPAELLSGTTAEELNAAADRLLAFRGEAPKPPVAPRGDWQGNVGEPIGNGAAQLSREDLKGMSPDAIVKAKSEGRLNDLLGIK